jgi:fatty-acyl-CoA synthase
MRGLMQDSALTVDKILDHAKNWHGDREVVTRSVEGPIVRTTYAQIHTRAKKVSNLLLQLGVTLGDRVATLAWNTARHMEAWYGIMGIGAICHTLNPRLHPEQIAWIINHAEDKIIFVDLTFVPILEAILAACPSVEHVVVMTDQAHMPGFKINGVPSMKWGGAHCYETAIGGQSDQCAWGGFDENTACGLCYTSGTTGDPKGVLYSHRSNVIHALVGLQRDVLGMSAVDTVLPVVPMFHANAWGTAFACPAVGAKLVMPGAKMDGASVYELLDSEEVTFSAAVPTVWQMLLAELDAKSLKLPHLTKVVIGGSACPESIIRGFKERYDVDVLHAWGMTETSPLGTLGSPNARVAKLSYDEQMPYKLKQGRPPYGIEMKLTDDAGNRLPHDGKTFGHLMVKGPFVVGEYFKGAGGEILDSEGFFDTGDVATIDPEGFMQITDRAKDVIKSGGEWISTIDIENITMGHPKVANAAVIGILHPKWDERPLLIVQLKPGETATKEEFIEFLQGKIAKWWMPDDVAFVDEIPLGATGKIDKKLLRTRFADYSLPEVPIAAAMAAAAATTVALRADADPVIHAPEPQEASGPFGPAAAETDADHPASPTVGEATVGQDETLAHTEDSPPTLEVESVDPAVVGAEAAENRIETLLAPQVAESVDPAPQPRPAFVPPEAVATLTAEPVSQAAPPAETKPEPKSAPLAEALIAGAAAAAAGKVVADFVKAPEAKPAAPEGQPVDARPAEAPATAASPDEIPESDLPLTWSPGGAAEPPRTEHVSHKPRKDEEDVPDALPGMPDMTPLGAAAVGAVAATAAVTSAKGGGPDLAFPSLKAAEPAVRPADEEPLSFTPIRTDARAAEKSRFRTGDGGELAFSPVPAGGRKKDKAKAGGADHFLSLAVMAALAPALIVAVGAAGMRIAAWDWREGFDAVFFNGPTPTLGWAPAGALVSVVIALIGLLVAAFGGWGRYWKKALLALGLSGATLAAFLGLNYWQGQFPRIHDVATDWSQPLLFTANTMSARGPDANLVEPGPVAPLDAGAFAGRPIAEINQETCPGARPAMVSLSPDKAFAAVKAAMLAQGITLVVDDPATGRLEGAATSPIYGFKDDVVARIQAQGIGSRVDFRSISRVGDSDRGSNCRRVGELTAAVGAGG